MNSSEPIPVPGPPPLVRQRDDALDVLRSYLVLFMIVAHAFMWHSTGTVNYNLSFHISIGFVLLAGLMFTGLNRHRMSSPSGGLGRKLALRALRLYAVFVAANLVVLGLRPARLERLVELGPLRAGLEMFFPDASIFVSFEILAPIALSILLIPLLVKVVRSRSAALVAIPVLLAAIVTTEATGVGDHYTIKLTLVGLLGGCIALLPAPGSWSRLRERLAASRGLTLALVPAAIVYFAVILTVWKAAPLTATNHLPGSVLMMSLVYLAALQLRPERWGPARLVSRTFGGHLLLAYLGQEAVLILSLRFIPKHQLGAAATVGMSILLVVATLLICLGMEYLEGRSRRLRRIYRLLLH